MKVNQSPRDEWEYKDVLRGLSYLWGKMVILKSKAAKVEGNGALKCYIILCQECIRKFEVFEMKWLRRDLVIMLAGVGKRL